MAGYVEQGPVLLNELVGPDIWRMIAELPKTAQEVRPGQFVHVKPKPTTLMLRRPLSVSDADPGAGTIELIYRVVGTGTVAMAAMKKGDILDSLGPLGTYFSMKEGKIIGVGGGVGIAPILFLARRVKGGRMTAVIGGRNREEIFWKDLFPRDTRVIITTDDGSFGIKGFAVSVLPGLLQEPGIGETAVCGPEILMKKTAEIAARAGIYCEVSMERRMGCGTGGCLACVCGRAGGGHYKVCLDGPVFDASEVIL